MAIAIEAPSGEAALTEFVQFYDRVYEQRPIRWQAMQALELPMLLGTSPFAEGRTTRPLLAREDGEIVARCVAAVDQRYLDHWGDDVGHVALFEAMPGAELHCFPDCGHWPMWDQTDRFNTVLRDFLLAPRGSS